MEIIRPFDSFSLDDFKQYQKYKNNIGKYDLNKTLKLKNNFLLLYGEENPYFIIIDPITGNILRIIKNQKVENYFLSISNIFETIDGNICYKCDIFENYITPVDSQTKILDYKSGKLKTNKKIMGDILCQYSNGNFINIIFRSDSLEILIYDKNLDNIKHTYKLNYKLDRDTKKAKLINDKLYILINYTLYIFTKKFKIKEEIRLVGDFVESKTDVVILWVVVI